MDETAPKLDDVVKFYLDFKDKIEKQVSNVTEESIIEFRSQESSCQSLSTSSGSTTFNESTMSESSFDDSSNGSKRKRKDSQSDKANMPSSKRSKYQRAK